jgi:plastocyanin
MKTCRIPQNGKMVRQAFLRMIVLFFLSFVFLPFGFAFEVQGKISVPPPFPEIKKVKVHKKIIDRCGDEQIPQGLRVSDEGGLKNAVISIKAEGDAAPLQNPAMVLDQKNCLFDPHVVVVPKGKTLRFINSDPLAHDVRAFSGSEMIFRFEIDTSGKPVDQKFEKSGIYVLRCGLHPWMHAYAIQAEHPYYAITDEDGNFNLKDIPAGNHTVHIWHEKLGEVDVPIEVKDSVNNFEYVFKATSN